MGCCSVVDLLRVAVLWLGAVCASLCRLFSIAGLSSARSCSQLAIFFGYWAVLLCYVGLFCLGVLLIGAGADLLCCAIVLLTLCCHVFVVVWADQRISARWLHLYPFVAATAALACSYCLGIEVVYNIGVLVELDLKLPSTSLSWIAAGFHISFGGLHISGSFTVHVTAHLVVAAGLGLWTASNYGSHVPWCCFSVANTCYWLASGLLVAQNWPCF
ncbi:unnamed protein product [Ilex paraguariensis]|uniref:Uncharacterized protein n=1 Tax=Ilex paraguariensis TaxID=185542 RepID=A0ABC8UJ78_9AQUA